nr:esterase [Propionibacterium sp.]
MTAGDGLPLTLLNVRGRHAPTREPVLLVHGAGVRAEIFRPPTPRTIVDALLDAGWDVWLLNWRASIDLVPVPWTLDDAASYDHPTAVRHIAAVTGSPTMRAIIHCQGSTSFAMAAAAGLLPEVTTIVSNAVSFHPVVPAFSRVKLHALRPLMGPLTPYLNPAWGDSPDSVFARAARAVVNLTHPECRNPVCKMVSFTYGSGRPALWSHANLDDATHEWLRGEFAQVPMSFFAQMDACVRAGHLVAVSTRPGLPAHYGRTPPLTDARWVLLAGRNNRCFLPESQERTFAWLDAQQPARHALHVIDGYGHLDVFLGARADRDVFPLMLEELARD